MFQDGINKLQEGPPTDGVVAKNGKWADEDKEKERKVYYEGPKSQEKEKVSFYSGVYILKNTMVVGGGGGMAAGAKK